MEQCLALTSKGEWHLQLLLLLLGLAIRSQGGPLCHFAILLPVYEFVRFCRLQERPSGVRISRLTTTEPKSFFSKMPKRKLGAKERDGEGVGAKKAPPGGTDDGPKWSKSKKKRMRAKLAKQNARQQGGGVSSPGKQQGRQHQKKKERGAGRNDQTRENKRQKKHEQSPYDNDTADGTSSMQQPRELNTSVRAKSALQQSFLARLSGSRFRELNEDLYTTTSDTAFKRFSENPELFDQYHEGFRKQVSQWPVNPVDVIIRWIRKKGAQKQGSKRGSLVIADFGCGDAKLGKELGGQSNQHMKKQKKQNGESKNRIANNGFKVHSFDLVANGNPLITPCDMANVPLDDGVVDIAVFCLALMGTNIADFIREAHRVLKSDGVIKIAEVRSRFEATADADDGHGGGGGGKKKTDDSLLNEFIDTMDELGFECTQKDRSNRMFILMEFAKTGEKPSKEATFTAKPCIYKRR